MSDFEARLGIVRHGRWLAWGYRHGVRVRPQWLADAIVTVWNLIACRLYGHEWCPEITWEDDGPRAHETDLFCPNCDAKSRSGGRGAAS